MGYIGVAVALYDYAAQADDELTIAEGDTLYLNELIDGEWYQATRQDTAQQGLVPANYVELRAPERVVVAEYDYDAQNDDELSMREGQSLDVLETQGEWLLARFTGTTTTGLVPANYVVDADAAASATTAAPVADIAAVPTPPAPQETASSVPDATMTAAETSEPQAPPAPDVSSIPILPPPTRKVPASVTNAHATSSTSTAKEESTTNHSALTHEDENDEVEQAEDDDEDARPLSKGSSVPLPSALMTQATGHAGEEEMDDTDGMTSSTAPANVPAAWTANATPHDEIQMWSVTQVDPKKKKKMAKGTLGIGNASLFFATDTDGASVPRIPIMQVQNAALEKNKYLILSINKASKVTEPTLVFHIGSKTAYQAITARLKESKRLAQQSAASSNSTTPRRGSSDRDMVSVLYDFEAQGDDELSVLENDQLVLIEKENDEWWKLQNAAGQVGVVPATYVKVIQPSANPHLAALDRKVRTMPVESPPVSMSHGERSSQRPIPERMREWVDATGKFKTEAELLGIRADTVRLHKSNGAVIEVPLNKMSRQDLRYLETISGRDLLSQVDKAEQRERRAQEEHRLRERERERERAAALKQQEMARREREARDRRPPRAHIDWFDFFLDAGVDVDYCTRYASAFERDHMDESVILDLEASMLRNLGLREGDILRVRRYIHQKYGSHTGSRSSASSRPMTREQLERQTRDDESLARRLQAQEIAAQRRTRPPPDRPVTTKEPLPPRRTPSSEPKETKAETTASSSSSPALQPTPTGVDAETIAAAVEIVRQREREEAEEKAKKERPADPNSALFDKLERMKPPAPPSPALQDPFAPRGPFAPVPINQGLLQPLIPLQGTGQFVPTGMPPNPTGFMPTHPTGFMPTGYGMQPTGMQPTGQGMFGVPQPMQQQQQQQQQPQPALGAATAETTSSTTDSDRFSAANVFEQMKTGAGAFGGASNDSSAPQSSGKYDPLRAQPTGFATGGIVDTPMQTGMMNVMPTGMGMMPNAPTGGFMPNPGYFPYNSSM